MLKASRIHVVPEPDGRWAVMQYNAFEGLWIDLHRWGLRIALRNFCMELGLAE